MPVVEVPVPATDPLDEDDVIVLDGLSCTREESKDEDTNGEHDKLRAREEPGEQGGDWGTTNADSLAGGEQPPTEPKAIPFTTSPGRVYMYDQLESKADMDGELNEVKYLTLLLVRGINHTDDCSLACNMKKAGAFDDAVLTFSDRSTSEKTSVFVQLKHKKPVLSRNKNKTKKTLKKESLLSISGDFALVKYCNAYLGSRNRFGENDLKHLGEFANFKFILFTNATLDKLLQNDQREPDFIHSLINTSLEGKAKTFESVLDAEFFRKIQFMIDTRDCLNEIKTLVEGVEEAKWKETINQLNQTVKDTLVDVKAQNKNILSFLESPTQLQFKQLWEEYSLVPDIESFYEFFTKFQLYTDQKSQEDLTQSIKDELRLTKHIDSDIDENELEVISQDLIKSVQEWWNKRNKRMRCLSENHEAWVFHRVSTLSRKKSAELDLYCKNVQFRREELIHIKNEIQRLNGCFKIIVDETTSLTTLKLYQALHCIKNKTVYPIFVSLKTLLQHLVDVLYVWQYSSCRTLIVECDFELKHASDKLKQLHTAITEINEFKKEPLRCIFISNSLGTFANNLKISMATYSQLAYENTWGQLTDDSQTKLILKEVQFQEHPIARSFLINTENRLTEHMNGECLTELALHEFPIGSPLAKLIPEFIPRRVKRGDGVVRMNRAGLIDDKVVLITAEPGMGKTTFLTHVATMAKESDSRDWVVRINLNDCTRYLKNNNFDDDEKLLDFFINCTHLKSHIEKTLFAKALFNLGNIIILIDGVDEVWSFYKENACQLLDNLFRRNQKQLWVASRVVCQETLQEILGVSPYGLEPFNEDDQRNVFDFVWKSVCPTITEEQSECFTNHVMRQSMETFKGENRLLSNPLLIRMVGVYFIKALKTFLKTGSFETQSSRIDLIILFDNITYNIFKIYCKEKKKDDLENASVKTDNKNMWEALKLKYMKAAMFLLVDCPQELASLISIEETEDFIHRIKSGEESTGIIDYITDDNKPHFIYRPIAEYFAALWLKNTYTSEPSKIFISNNFTKPDFGVVFSFFNRMLAKDSSATTSLHLSVLNQDWESFEEILVSQSEDEVNAKDAGGRTALHIAVMYSGVQRDSIFKDMITSLLDHHASAEDVDNVLHWTPLQYADYTKAWTVARLILRKTGRTEGMVFSKQNMNTELFDEFIKFLTSDTDSVRIMHLGAKHGDVSVLRYLLEECEADVECHLQDGICPMHVAASAGKIEAMSFLKNNGASYCKADTSGNIPMMCAAKHGQFATIKYIFDESVSMPLAISLDVTNNERWSSLMYAADFGNTDIIEYLFARGARIKLECYNDLSDHQKNTILMCFAFQGDLSATQQLLKNHNPGTCFNSHGAIPLHWAILSRNYDLVAYLVKMQASVTFFDYEGNRSLHYAAKKCNSFGQHLENAEMRMQIVELLLKEGGDVLSANKNGDLPKDVAKISGFLEMYDFLSHEEDESKARAEKDLAKLQEKEKVEVALKTRGLLESAKNGDRDKVLIWIANGAAIGGVNEQGRNALHIASENGHTDVVRELLEQKMEIDTVDNYGNTPFHLASLSNKNYFDTMQCLLDYNCDVKKANNDELTPLLSAANRNAWDVARFIVQHDEETKKAADKDGQTVLHKACIANNVDEVKFFAGRCQMTPLVPYLYKEIGPPDTFGDTPLTIAIARNCSLDVVKCLLDEGADLKQVFSKYHSRPPLHIAVQFGRLDVLECILERYMGNLLHADRDGTAPIHTATLNKDIPIIICLAKNGANLNALDSTGQRPMHMAAEFGSLEVITCLASFKDTKVSAWDFEGRTPLTIAKNQGWNDIVAFLESVDSGKDGPKL